MYKLIACLFLSFSLFADVEYDIVLLAPEGQEFVEFVWSEPRLNESGYAWRSDSKKYLSPFIYHKEIGFKVIPVPLNEYDELRIAAVNNQGIAVGILSKQTSYWEPTEETLFVYNAKSGEYYNLIDQFNSGREEEYSFEDPCFQDLTITDNHEIIFKRCSDLRTYIYNLNDKTIRIFTNGSIYAVNAKGHMIGGDSEYSWDCNKSWFFDLKTFHSLGSLDTFKRWTVEPMALSQNGLVAGKGLDSYKSNKVFIWDSQAGLNQMDCPSEYFSVQAVNNHREVIGTFEIKEDRDHAFILSPTLGFLALGVLEGGKESVAHAINNRGQVVGESRGRDSKKAFIWDAERGMRDLNALIPKDAPGWKGLTEANSINDAGQIVGKGRYFGVEQFFLLIPKSE